MSIIVDNKIYKESVDACLGNIIMWMVFKAMRQNEITKEVRQIKNKIQDIQGVSLEAT